MDANKCHKCPGGTTTEGGKATDCHEVVCEENERVRDQVCERCPEGYTHPAGAVATGLDTECEMIQCRQNENFDGQTCVSCPPGHTHPGQSSLFEDDDCTLLVELSLKDIS